MRSVDDDSRSFRNRHLLVFQFTWELIFLNYDISRMTFISIMCADIRAWFTLATFSSSSTEMNFKEYERNTRSDVSSTVLRSVDDFASTLSRHSYARRWSMKFWLESQSINATIFFLFVDVSNFIDVHKWENSLWRLRIVNTWTMLIDLDLFSFFCRSRCSCIEIYNDQSCCKRSTLCVINSSLNELASDLNSRWLLLSSEIRSRCLFWDVY
jgi:hypothetical protein